MSAEGKVTSVELKKTINTAVGLLSGAERALSGADIEPLMTAEEVSQYFRLGLQTVYNMASSGTLPSVKIGGALRFRKSEIIAYNENRRHQAKQG